MALPSQSVSQNARGRYMYRRRRRHRFPMVAVTIVALVICGGVWWALDAYSGTDQETTEPLQAAVEPVAEPTSSASNFDAQRRSRTLETTLQSPPPPSGWTAPAAAPPAPATVTAAPVPTPMPTQAPAANSAPSNFLPSGQAPSESLQRARQLLAQDQPVEARALLSANLAEGGLTPAEKDEARYMLSSINDRLVFSSEIVPGDPFTIAYTVRPGDSLAKIVKSLGVQVDWRLLQRVNGLARPDQIQPGQVLKVVTGPFHGAIARNNHRLDLYLGEGPNEVFVKEFLVGLGEHHCTPSGLFRVRTHSKLINPPWTNPRTREHYAANDPDNPIGEFWLGLEGISEHNRQEAGFGMHGTIDPGSIGRNESMGCVRMRDGEIDVLYEVMTEGVSTLWVDNGVQASVQVPGG